jgi:site-specific recombinase XerC
MQNQNINRISFHTFRNRYATMEYHKTKKLVHVQQKLGHKSIITTTILTYLINFDADTYHSEVAQTVKEVRKRVEAGFKFVCDMDGYRLFRKPR